LGLPVDAIAKSFRETRIGLLRFFADPVEQLSFAKATHYADYESEFFCWWFDDFHPDSELFSSAFSGGEIGVLSSFSAEWDRESACLGQKERSMDELLSTSSWNTVIEAARHALSHFRDSSCQ
jgi:hypothetical protein